jgi:hypothetical protein
MSGVTRQYRLRVAAPGAPQVDGHVALTLGVDVLYGVPTVTGQIVSPTQGSTILRPWTATVIDHAGQLTAALVAAGRWNAIGRLADVAYQEAPEGPWVVYGTGRISRVAEVEGPRLYQVEISDESWVGRKARLFDTGTTTRLWPSGLTAHWRGWDGPPPTAAGVREEQNGYGHFRIRVTAGGLGRSGANKLVSDTLVRWVETQVVDTPKVELGSVGNFHHLRLNYAGQDYAIIAFGRAPNVQDVVAGLRPEGRRERNTTNAAHTIEVDVWVYVPIPFATPPASGPAFLHAPTAPVGSGVVKHIGVADPADPFGSADGWLHAAELTQRVWEATGELYEADSIAAVLADKSIPLCAPRVSELVDNVHRYMEEEIWGPRLLVAMRSRRGRRKLVNMRLPQGLDPNTLPVLNAGNCRVGSWRLLGTEVVNSISWKYLHHGHSQAGPARDATVQLDGLYIADGESRPIEDAESIAARGRRPLQLSLRSALEPTALVGLRQKMQTRGGALFDDATRSVSRELLDIFRDGAARYAGEVFGPLAEQLEEGDLALLDMESLQLPNPGTGARTGLRLVRLMTMGRAPAHGDVELLDLGPSAQPLAVPSISISQNPADRDELIYQVSDVPAGASAVVEIGYSSSATPPASWLHVRTDLQNGTYTLRGVPSSGYMHARIKAVAPQRIRSVWANTSVLITVWPQILDARLEIDGEGIARVYGTPLAGTAGVRVIAELFAPSQQTGEVQDAQDFPAAALADDAGAELAGITVPPGWLCAARVRGWSGFAAGAVTGTPGDEVVVSARVPARADLVPTLRPRSERDLTRNRAAVHVELVSPAGDQVTLRLRERDDDAAPVWRLVEEQGSTAVLYVDSGEEVGPEHWFEHGGEWAQKLAEIELRPDAVAVRLLQGVARTGQVESTWIPYPVGVGAEPIVDAGWRVIESGQVEVYWRRRAPTVVVYALLRDLSERAHPDGGTDPVWGYAAPPVFEQFESITLDAPGEEEVLLVQIEGRSSPQSNGLTELLGNAVMLEIPGPERIRVIISEQEPDEFAPPPDGRIGWIWAKVAPL